MSNKVLTKEELDLIQTEINSIGKELEWLDPNIPGEGNRIINHTERLGELEKILLTSLKNHRKNKVKLTVVE